MEPGVSKKIYLIVFWDEMQEFFLENFRSVGGYFTKRSRGKLGNWTYLCWGIHMSVMLVKKR